MGLMDTLKGVVGGNTHEGTQNDAKAAGAHDQSHLVDKTDKDVTGSGGSNLTDRYGMGQGGVSKEDRLADQATTRIGDHSTAGTQAGKGEGFMSTRDERDEVPYSGIGKHGSRGPANDHASGITGEHNTASHPTNLTGGQNTTGHSQGGITGAAAMIGAGAASGGRHEHEHSSSGGDRDYKSSGNTGLTSGQGYNSSTQQTGSGEGHHHHSHGHSHDHGHDRDSGNSDGNLGMGSLGEQGLKQGHVGQGGRAGGFDGVGEGYADGNMGAGYTPFGDNSPISSDNKSGQTPTSGSSGLGSSGHSHSHGHSHGLTGSNDQSSGDYSRTGGDNYSSGNQSGSAGANLTGAAGAGQRGAQQVAPGQFDESRNNY